MELREAVWTGDLDVVRFHLEIRGAEAESAMRLAVGYSQPHLVNFLISNGTDCNAGRPGHALLHDALVAWVQDDYEPDGPAFAVIKALADGGADLDAAIVPLPPKPGSVASHKADCAQALTTSRLPFLRRGDNPLAWIMTVHMQNAAENAAEDGDRRRDRRPRTVTEDSDRRRAFRSASFAAFVQCLVRRGASLDNLPRRQHQVVQEILEESEPGYSRHQAH